jgi:HSP20 family protein|tara:strand:- start:5429 stop:5842 length:414 start_codon:yes stop_codon:yes gene_type:complete
MKLTTYRGDNPIKIIEESLNGFLNLTPVFHNLEELYRTGDQVRFSNNKNALSIQIDIPGCKKDDLDLDVDSDQREVYIKGKRAVKTHDGEQVQTMNRSFSIGKEYDLNFIKFTYEYGVLEVSVPRRKKEEYIKKYTV